jgi:hypothetical protein
MDRVRSLSRWRLGRAGLLALLLCVPVTGCGPGRGEVSGTVRYNGKPLPFGAIQFLGPDGVPCSGPIQPDGTFSVQVPTGEAKVIISCVDEARMNRFSGQLAAGREGRAAPPPSSSANFSLIPQRYTDWNTSGLSVLVGRGKTVQDFALTSN